MIKSTAAFLAIFTILLIAMMTLIAHQENYNPLEELRPAGSSQSTTSYGKTPLMLKLGL